MSIPEEAAGFGQRHCLWEVGVYQEDKGVGQSFPINEAT